MSHGIVKRRYKYSHAWYSQEEADEHGYGIFRGITGEEVKVTYTNHPSCMYTETHKKRISKSIYVGIIRECIMGVNSDGTIEICNPDEEWEYFDDWEEVE
jgi:hypothetical protein